MLQHPHRTLTRQARKKKQANKKAMHQAPFPIKMLGHPYRSPKKTSKQASKKTSKQASKQGSKEQSKQAKRRANNKASQKARKTRIKQGRGKQESKKNNQESKQARRVPTMKVGKIKEKCGTQTSTTTHQRDIQTCVKDIRTSGNKLRFGMPRFDVVL